MQRIDSSKFELFFLQAEAARYYNAFELSEKSFKKVLKNEKSEYFLPAMLGLATVQKMQGDYKNAISGFKNYLLLNPDSSSVGHIEAKNQIQACNWATDLVKFNDRDLIISQLGDEVNTDFSDFAPVRYGDKLLFSSLRFSPTDNQKDNSKRYSKVLELKDGTTEAKEFELDISNEDLHSAHIAFNEAKNRMYFNICHFKEGNIINCKIYFRNQVSDTVWTKPIALPENINQKNVTVTHPNIGIDENSGKEILFFCIG